MTRQESIQRIATAPDSMSREAAIQDHCAKYGQWWERAERCENTDQDGTVLMSAGSALERLPHKPIMSDAMRAWLCYAAGAGFVAGVLFAVAVKAVMT
jgi:hypothetical protein